MKRTILLLLIAGFLGGCGKDSLLWDSTVNYSLSGRVVDVASGMPLEGLTVSLKIMDGVFGILDIKGKQVVTDNDGMFRITYKDHRENLIYVAQIYIDLPESGNYQEGLLVNNEEYCRAYFSVGETGNYEIRALPHPLFRLQIPAVPTGWSAGALSVTLSMKNTNCSDTLLVEQLNAHLNDSLEMNALSSWRTLHRSNEVGIDYKILVDQDIVFSRQFSAICAYGGKTDVFLLLE